MSRGPELHECEHVLIVEGPSDLFFFADLLHRLGRLPQIFIQEFKGKPHILNRQTLGDFLNPKLLAEKKTIGIIVDADDDPAGTTQSLRDHLRAITGRQLVEGQWADGEPRLGFLVVPNGDSPGEIETLVWDALPVDARHTGMKEAVVSFHGQMEKLGWKARSRDKGSIGAFLSAAHDEDPRLGPGARQGVFELSGGDYDRLRSFLEGFPPREG